ncbi:Lhr-like helicase [Ectothiorhodospira sp. PHS-1]|uniref:DEAD/DEAH box helicase n=1 Tax=Ectothiorhodospira sp. PHS-1 TaxID=519989 RepID=UPI00024A833A|nr:DEAD/DEAH box helicase [Ectothiorhodospira sp. PHS-1]EHQ53311.1 Lhr-like helicase [Ectothiorhodospira sp. PHS-1]
MTAFDRLHPALQHHIANSLGWPRLRPVQEATIDPVLDGSHAILLAPTAGGKTEAACFPVFSRMLTERWEGVSVLYVCPIKALLNNLLPRLEHYAGLLGRRVALWHGDVGAARRARIVSDPPDILLTTPESLEAILVSARVDHRRLLGQVRVVIIDEVHAFAGDDRGWHLLAVLERVSRIAGREIQRLGLSATVGNPEALAQWLAGGQQQSCHVIDPPAPVTVETQVELDWVGSLENAALVISRLYRGEKRLVFVDSRARVEQIAMELRGLGVNTFVSHSSLSLEERRASEAAFAQGRDCVIVATSTLELGIDVGDLDRVIQVDAPWTVSSFLQRIGRTGRRRGSIRNCLFLATTEDAFLRALGLLHLWRQGYVEPVQPPAMPLHIHAQQIMALVLQEQGVIADDIPVWIGGMPGFAAINPRLRQRLLDGMIETGILHSDQGMLGIGRRGEQTFGHRHFMDLVSVFITPPTVRVLHGKRELGEVHELTFGLSDEGPVLLTLAGRNWMTRHVDWPRRCAYVEPCELRGRAQWLSVGQPMNLSLCQAIKQVLADGDFPPDLSRRARERLASLQEEYDWVDAESTGLIMDGEGHATWWTFAGAVCNAALAQALRPLADRVTADNLAISFSKLFDRDAFKDRLARQLAQAGAEGVLVPLDARFIQELKFAQCLPQSMIDEEIRARYRVDEALALLQGQTLDLLRI